MKHEAIKKIFENKKESSPKRKKMSGRPRKNNGKKPMPYNGIGAGKFLVYEQAKLFCHAAEIITTNSEYKEWVRIKKYKFLPLTPNITYGDKWEGWGEYLGTGTLPPQERKDYKNYLDAKFFAQKMAKKYDINSQKDWLNFLDDQALLPMNERDTTTDVYRNPNYYYDEWEGWDAFLGKTMKHTVDALQQKERIEQEVQEDFFSQYDNKPLLTVLANVDSANKSLIQVIINSDGLLNMLMVCDKCVGDIAGIFHYNNNLNDDILHILTSKGLDRGNRVFMVEDINFVITELDTLLGQVPKKHYE